MPGFKGKVAFISGGATGIGLACARAVLDGAGRVMLAARRRDVLENAVSTLGYGADFVECDVTQDASVDAAIARTVERFGSLNLAVNAAGMGMAGPVTATATDAFAMTIDTNLTGVMRCIRAEANVMKKAGGGSIVNISSIAGVLTHRWMSAYCVSKAGVNMLTRCAADELGEHGIRVNAVMPGLVDTELAVTLTSSEAATDEYKRRMPISRIGIPADVGAIVGFLLSDEAGWITGQCIGVDGGHTLRQGPELVDLFRPLMPDVD
ncbi:MAG TPA: SDR family oxidoreductase [Candidatus Limnocylindrales bacterium]|nr:SDR family oxidoreductase [Candidatus Limnocylindrales bacterium]